MLKKIKMLCLMHDTNVKQLEIALGIGSGTIARWDDVSPRLNTVILVADYFHVSIDYLLGRESEEDNTEDYVVCGKQLNDKGKEILNAAAKGLLIQPEYRKQQ